MNEQFNWYKKPTGTQRYTTLTCVRADAPAKISKIWKLVRSCTSSISLVCVTFTIAIRYKECSVQLVTLETTIEHWPGERRPMPRRRPVGIQSSGPDYKMCTVCTCTGASLHHIGGHTTRQTWKLSKKVISFYGKNCGGPTKTVHTLPR